MHSTSSHAKATATQTSKYEEFWENTHLLQPIFYFMVFHRRIRLFATVKTSTPCIIYILSLAILLRAIERCRKLHILICWTSFRTGVRCMYFIFFLGDGTTSRYIYTYNLSPTKSPIPPLGENSLSHAHELFLFAGKAESNGQKRTTITCLVVSDGLNLMFSTPLLTLWYPRFCGELFSSWLKKNLLNLAPTNR